MSDYVIIWKDRPGQQVGTVVDTAGNPVVRTAKYVTVNNYPVAEGADTIYSTLEEADGTKFAVSVANAREVLGWEV